MPRAKSSAKSAVAIMPAEKAKQLKKAAHAAHSLKRSEQRRFILLPANKMQAEDISNPEVSAFLVELSGNVASRAALRLTTVSPGKARSSMKLNVLDSIHENGAKLVTMDAEHIADFRFSYPGLRIIPEKFYELNFRHKPVMRASLAAGRPAVAGINSVVTVVDPADEPIKGAYLVAFTDFEARIGGSGTTNARGEVRLKLESKHVERLYVYPDHTYWGAFMKNFDLTASYQVALNRIDLNWDDALRHFYPTRIWPAITNALRVGIIDTGFGPHQDITIKGGANMVLNENIQDYSDHEGHGTHVAGIIAAHGAMPGVAQGVELYIYRVFPTGKSASNYDIMKAIDRAKADQCDLINMSLGEQGLDEGIVSSIKDAYSAGVVCIAANGNDQRAPVSFPASYSLTIAVSAMGRKGSFPNQTVQTGIVKTPYGTDKNNFIADFSNIGPETDLVAPGVGIISTYPDNKYAVMDGTSMACPAATGMAARLLSSQTAILAMPRNQVRADAITKFLGSKIKSLGFSTNFEGKGMLFP